MQISVSFSKYVVGAISELKSMSVEMAKGEFLNEGVR
jgi:hypothetical protein